MEFAKKAKFRLFISFMFYLCFQQFVVETKSASIKASDVAKYLIQRKFSDRGDVFHVSFKQTCQRPSCKPSDIPVFCRDLSAYIYPGNFPYSCSCEYGFKTFLPEKGKCVADQEVVTTLQGTQNCSQYQLSWDDLFLEGFDLRNNGTHSYYMYVTGFQSCKVIHRSPMYYDSIHKRWKQISSEIFTVSFKKYRGIILEWRADTNKELSGRIICLIVTCNYTDGSPPLKGCLLLKAVGDVTYNYVNQSVVQETGCPSTTVPSLVPTESSLLLQLSSVTSSLLSSPSSTSSSPSALITPSLPSPLSSLSPSPSPLTFSSTVIHVATTVQDGPGNKEARANGNDYGAVIGGAVGGAVVFGILAFVIIKFCKRRKMWKNKEETTELEVKNPVNESSDTPLSTTTENQATICSEQDNQPTYQDLIINNGQLNGSAVYSIPEVNYDNCTVYQSLDKKVPGTPVYQSLEPDSAGPNKGGVGYAAPNGSTSADAHDNPAYQQSLELYAPYASVQRPGSQKESVYEPLRGPADKQDLYEPLS